MRDEITEGLQIGTIKQCAFCHGLSDDRREIGYAGLFSEDVPSWLSHSNDFIGPWTDNRSSIKAQVWVHRRCALWAPKVYIDDKTLQMKNVVEEVRRAKRLYCAVCKKPGASNGCIMDRCTQSFHIFCAEDSFCFVDHSQFQIICPNHFLLLFRQRFNLNLVYNRPSSLSLYQKIQKYQAKAKTLDRTLNLNAPLNLDLSHQHSVIGLESTVQTLRESLILPLVYRELFSQLQLEVAGGIILHGPPGNGKTSLVRSVVSECERLARRGVKITVYSRKAADVLSRFYGEAEKNLRDLFDLAEEHQPSVIFFDEFDALVPARNSRQNQVHNSIVATLLSLMDGLSKRGRVVVIAATNRVDAIDPALRRPGRFDKEVFVPHPNRDAKRQMLHHFLSNCQYILSIRDIEQILDRCGFFSGADMKGLCVEAVMRSIERHFPDMQGEPCFEDIVVERIDMENALLCIGKGTNGLYVSHEIYKLLKPSLDRCIAKCSDLIQSRDKLQRASSILMHKLLLHGEKGHGQREICSLLLSFLDLPVFEISLSSCMASEVPPKFVADQCSNAISSAPSVLFLPNLDEFVSTAGSDSISALQSCLASFPMHLDKPVLVLASIAFEWGMSAVWGNRFPLFFFRCFNRHTLKCSRPSPGELKTFLTQLCGTIETDEIPLLSIDQCAEVLAVHRQQPDLPLKDILTEFSRMSSV